MEAQEFRYAGQEATDEQEALVRAWMNEDPCFGVTVYARWGLVLRGLDGLNAGLAEWTEHTATCQRCYENVMIGAQNEPDPLRRRIYTNAGFLVVLDYIRTLGGDYAIGGDPEKPWVRITYPANSKIVRGYIYYPPVAPGEHAIVAIEAAGQSDLTDAQLLQELEAAQVQHLQDFSRLGAPALAWWSLVSDGDVDLYVMRGDELRPVLGGPQLLGRYKRLVTARWRHLNPRLVEAVSDGEAADLLERLLMDYDASKSWVRGFLNTRLWQRRDDHDERAAREVPLTVPTTDGGEVDNPARPDVRVVDDWKESHSGQHLSVDQHERRGALKAALARLSARELQFLALRSEGHSDPKIAAEFGLSRERVNKVIAAALRKLQTDVETARNQVTP